MKIGVTGASGFIGRKLCKALIESDFEVYKFVRREPKNDSEIYWKPSKKEIDQEKFESLDAIIHSWRKYCTKRYFWIPSFCWWKME